MASFVSSVTSNTSSSSIYGNRNVISGLASGMDTESMIENAVSGIKLKVTELQQDKTKVEWEQSSLRDIIDKLANFSEKYTSYASNTNLLSSSFFNNAINVSTNGKYADLISASGKTSSDIQILGVKDLASAATYRTKLQGTLLSGNGTISGSSVNLATTTETSNITGTLTLKDGNNQVTLNITSEDGVVKTTSELAELIQKKLDDAEITINGATKNASEIFSLKVTDDTITFSSSNATSISASGDLKTTLGIEGSDTTTIKVEDPSKLYTSTTVAQAISGKEMKFTLDGVTKTITLPTYDDSTALSGENFLKALQTELNKAFGTGKVSLGIDDPEGKGSSYSGSEFTLSFSVQEGSTLSISSDVGKALGLQSNYETSYVNTGKTLGELFGDNLFSELNPVAMKAVGNVTKKDDKTFVDEDGNTVAQFGDEWYQVDEKGAQIQGYELKINDVTIGTYNKDTALESIMVDINNNTEAGVKVTFSQTTNQFQLAATETGAANGIEIEKDGLAAKLFGSIDVSGTDAVLSVKVNGSDTMEMTRSSNSFSIDGLTVNLKGKFGYVELTKEDDDGNLVGTGEFVLDKNPEAVTFTSETDADTIVDAVKSMVEDYNEIVKAVRDAFNTMPAQQTDGSRYEPLTAEDKADMTESEIAAYEEKAKQGLLFMDSDLSSLYSALVNAITPTGSDGSMLRSIGINSSYSDGVTTLSLDEDALRQALASNPDNVQKAFTKTAGNGSTTDGLMQSIREVVDRYGKTTGTKGILVERAGSVKAPSTLNSNTIQDQLDDIDDQISKWQEKLSDQIDYYTSKFTQLEQLIAQMNSQSSTLSGMMGGY
ncbi:MAG: flagellar filament capping protein FliD [Acutalibacter sp.]